jgi:DNA-binding CsgD family transcriptional regulator
MRDLLERELELAAIESGLSRCAAGDGSLLLVEGDAGIGKTELLRAAAARAAGHGLQVMSSRGGELEQEYGYGVIRQLLGPVIAALPAEEKTGVLAGAAGLAAPVMELGDSESTPDRSPHPDLGAVLHGLYWLTLNLAARQPVLIELDDAHWSDSSSMRFIAFLARRLEGVPALVMLSTRTGQPSGVRAIIEALASEPVTTVLRPQPLTASAVTQLIADSIGGEVDSEFARSCARATGGVPFLLNELIGSMRADGVQPTHAAVALVDRLSPEAVMRSTTARLDGLGEAAVLTARIVAVLGAAATTARVSAIAQFDPTGQTEALDALVLARILQSGLALEFVHPVVRTSVYEDIPPHLRAELHARAASLLAAAARDPEEVAAHLLCTVPSDDARDLQLLSQAATAAVARGAPDAAVMYLRQAVEGAIPGEPRGLTLLELGRCELMVHDPACIAHLRAAIELLHDRDARAGAALALAGGLLYVADFGASRAVLAEALDQSGERPAEQVVALEALSACASYGDPRFNAEVRADLPRLRALAERAGPAARSLNVFLALVSSTNGEDTSPVLELILRGLDDGRLLQIESSNSIAVALAVDVLLFIDELDLADELAAAMAEDARRRGLVVGFIAAAAHRGLVALRRGALARAEAEARAALDAAQQHDVAFTIPFTMAYLAAAMIERGSAREAAAMLSELATPPGFERTLGGASLVQVRGRSRLAVGDSARGVADLRSAGDALDALGIVNPNVHGWRSELAVAIGADDPAEARELVETELAQARRVNSARAVAVALHASALLGSGDQAIAALREAASILEDSPARLEHARALTDLGAALRRANARHDAREPLRQGIELATRCGASLLVERARYELLACGGRPRRLMITGRDSLTPSEQRIAELAGEGGSNRDIAQALFITPKTVENHLGRVYKKLAINSRDELPAKLAAEHPAA